MSKPPKSEWVECPVCQAAAVAVIPRDSTLVESQAASDGKVRVNCHECEEAFRVYYRTEE